MSKQQKQLLLVAALLFLFWKFKNRQPAFRAAYEPDGAGAGEVESQDDYFYGGGGSGYVASGSDGTDSQNYDPASDYTEPDSGLNQWGFPGDFKPGGTNPVRKPIKPLPTAGDKPYVAGKSLARILR
jgi:hypothetical protein